MTPLKAAEETCFAKAKLSFLVLNQEEQKAFPYSASRPWGHPQVLAHDSEQHSGRTTCEEQSNRWASKHFPGLPQSSYF